MLLCILMPLCPYREGWWCSQGHDKNEIRHRKCISLYLCSAPYRDTWQMFFITIVCLLGRGRASNLRYFSFLIPAFLDKRRRAGRKKNINEKKKICFSRIYSNFCFFFCLIGLWTILLWWRRENNPSITTLLIPSLQNFWVKHLKSRHFFNNHKVLIKKMLTFLFGFGVCRFHIS